MISKTKTYTDYSKFSPSKKHTLEEIKEFNRPLYNFIMVHDQYRKKYE